MDYFTVDVASATDYYPFGMGMPGRKVASEGYRYGFNGKEEDKDIHSTTIYDYGFRVYNPALGKFLSVDPLRGKYPWYTPYQFSGNKPIACIDLDGLEEQWKVEFDPRVDYKPVFDAPGVLPGVNNAIHNGLSFVWNGVVGSASDLLFGTWNLGVDAVYGKFDQVYATDLFVNGLDRLNDYWSHTSGQQKISDLNTFVSDIRNWEAIVAGGGVSSFAKKSVSLSTFVGKGAGADMVLPLADELANIAKSSKAPIEYVSVYGQKQMDKFIVLGRNQADRVEVFAQELKDRGMNVKTILNDLPLGPDDVLQNGSWLDQQIKSGYSIIDIGLDPRFTSGQATGTPNFDFGGYYGFETYLRQTVKWDADIIKPVKK
ncbi:hypothetical protein JMG10_02640 [Nostoc ellipsosporum NOK]|nr:hypothetical protein [Nostoc ellipsosporum NOK]